jgi:hypothetical protein
VFSANVPAYKWNLNENRDSCKLKLKTLNGIDSAHGKWRRQRCPRRVWRRNERDRPAMLDSARYRR